FWYGVRRVRPPRMRGLVEPVVDRLHLRRGNADLLDREAAQGVGDGDHAVGEPCQAALDEPECAGAEWIVVVLRGDERRAAELRCETAVQVGVHEMRVHDVGSEVTHEPREEYGIEIAWRGDAHRRHGERVVEGDRVPRG